MAGIYARGYGFSDGHLYIMACMLIVGFCRWFVPENPLHTQMYTDGHRGTLGMSDLYDGWFYIVTTVVFLTKNESNFYCFMVRT
jgi:hypothetical protein